MCRCKSKNVRDECGNYENKSHWEGKRAGEGWDATKGAVA